MLNALEPFIGTIPQWITAAGVVSFLGLLVRWRLGERKLAIEATSVNVRAREVEGVERADLRDHYAEELSSLRSQIIDMGKHHLEREREIDDRWRKVLSESEARHAECVRQREDLARRVIRVEGRLLGTIRQFIHFQHRVAEAVAKGGDAVEVLASLQPFIEDNSLVDDAGSS